MARFVPADFQLYEFEPDPNAPGRWWLPSWQGIVGQPAEEVCLGWRGADGRQAVVATARVGRHPSTYDRRHNTVFLIFAGRQLETPLASVDPATAHAVLAELAGQDRAWVSRTILVDGQPVTAETTELAEHRVNAGYVLIDDRIASFATVAVEPSAIKLRTLTAHAATKYPTNPTEPSDAATPVGFPR